MAAQAKPAGKTFQDESKFIEKVDAVRYRINPGFVPNMVRRVFAMALLFFASRHEHAPLSFHLSECTGNIFRQ
jgi:hypothetical protein